MKTAYSTRLPYHLSKVSLPPHHTQRASCPGPASSTFHDTPQPLLGLSQSRKTLSLEPFLPPPPPPPPPLFVFLSSSSSSSSSRGQTELYLHPFYLSSLCPSTSLQCGLGFFQQATLTPAGWRQLKPKISAAPACLSWQEVSDRRLSRWGSQSRATSNPNPTTAADRMHGPPFLFCDGVL